MPEGDRLRDSVRHSIVTSSDMPVSYVEGIVHQALGMTMESVGCNALPALELLDAQSEGTKRPLVSVAVDVIDGATGQCLPTGDNCRRRPDRGRLITPVRCG